MSAGRHLLMIATGHYSDPDVWEDLEAVDDETQVWTNWLTDPGLGDRAFTLILDDLARSPGLTRINAALGEGEGFRKDRDLLVCYITGHGEEHNGQHRLVLSTSLPDKPSSMLETSKVLEWALDRFSTALVVVDTCYAGRIATPLASLDMPLPLGWVVIAAASAHDQARLGKLTDAVEAFAQTGADQDAQPYLDYWDLMRALAESLQDQKWQRFGTDLPPSNSRMVTLPNRYYRPQVNARVPVEAARQDVAMYESDLAAHWDPRSRGVGDASTPGMLFTGRDRLLWRLIAAARGEPGALVVTGSAGCGKSAVLSRLVTFSDPGFRTRYADELAAAEAAGEPLPGIGDVDVAVLAKGAVTQRVLDAIRDRLGIPAVEGETAGDTITRIHDRGGVRRVTLVIDALDEAEDPRGIVNTVLAPLVNPPGAPWLRVLIGVRGSAQPPPPAGPDPAENTLAAATVRALSAKAVDASAPPFWTEADLAAYVARLLRTPLADEQSNPYDTVDDDRIRVLANTVARIAGTSYVLARMISDQLRRQPHPQDPTDQAWQARSRAGLAEILTDELEQNYPDPVRLSVTRTLLTAASLGRGRGIPRRKIWPAIAQALDPTGREYTDTDIATLLDEHIGGYLVRDVADNATVYRPFHDALADALTSTVDRDSRRRVTAALLELFTVVRSHGLVIPPLQYLRRHTVEHAADSGDLDQVIHNPDVLTWSDPDHLIPLLGEVQTPTGRAIGRVYRTIAHTLRTADRHPDTFALQLRARQAGLHELADGLTRAAPNQTGHPRWATPRQDSDHHRIDTSFSVNCLVAAALPDGTPVIVSGDEEMLQVWRLTDGTPVWDAQPWKPWERGHFGWVTAVAVGALPDRTPVIVSVGLDHALQVWRLTDGTPIGKPRYVGDDHSVNAVAVGALPDRTPVIVSGGDRTVRVWRLTDGTPIGEPLRGHTGRVNAVAVGALPDRTPVIVSGGDRTVRVWRLTDGAAVGEPLRGHTGMVTAVAVGALPDRTPVIVSGSYDGTARVWRLADGTPIGEPLRGHTGMVTAVAVGALPDRTPVTVSGSDDGTMRVWRLTDGTPIGEPLQDMRWLLTDDTPVGEPPLRNLTGSVTAVAIGALPDRTAVIISGSVFGMLHVWRLTDGTRVGEPLRGHTGRVNAVAVGALPDRTPVIVSGGDRTVRVWRLTDGTPVGKPLRGHTNRVNAIAVGALPDGTKVIVSGSDDGTMRIRRLADGTPVGEPLHGHDSAVTAVAVGALPDRTPVIVSGSRWDRTVRVWRLADRNRIGGPWDLQSPVLSVTAVGALIIAAATNDLVAIDLAEV